jgi:hypothetical protein
MHNRDENVYRILVGKSEGKKLLGRIWRKRENNNTLDLKGIGW